MKLFLFCLSLLLLFPEVLQQENDDPEVRVPPEVRPDMPCGKHDDCKEQTTNLICELKTDDSGVTERRCTCLDNEVWNGSRSQCEVPFDKACVHEGDKKSICEHNSQCLGEGDTKKCSCEADEVWSESRSRCEVPFSKKCVSQGDKKSICEPNSQCLNMMNKNKACKPNQNCKCICKNKETWEHGKCKVKREKRCDVENDDCQSNTECQKINNQAHKCKCPPHMLWKPKTKTCVNRCTNPRIWNNVKRRCEAPASYGEACGDKDGSKCASKFVCKDEKCRCKDFQKWAKIENVEECTSFDLAVAQNFKNDLNNELQNLFTDYLRLELLYKLYAAFFARADVALPGFTKYFKGHSDHMRGQAVALTTFVNMRGGMVQYQPLLDRAPCETIIRKEVNTFNIRDGSRAKICLFQTVQTREHNQPSIKEITDNKPGLRGLEDALAMENFIMRRILHAITQANSEKIKDAHAKHTLEEFLAVERPAAVKKLVSRLKAVTDEDYVIAEVEMDAEMAA